MTKPEWAVLAAAAGKKRSQALILDELSERRRCPAVESGGVQCTADETPGHQHRHDPKDMPS